MSDRSLTVRRRLAVAFSLGVLAALPAPSGAHEPAAPAKVVTVRSDIFCPFVCDADGDQPGYVIELTRAAFAVFGYQVDYRVVPYARAIEATRQGAFDMVAAIAIDDAPDLLFSRAVGNSPTVLATRRGSGFSWQGASSLDPLRIGAVIGIESWGGGIAEYIAAHRDNPARVDFSGGHEPYATNLRKLLAGRVDIIADSEPVLIRTARRLQVGDAIEIHPTGVSQVLYMGLSPTNPRSAELIRAFNAGLDRVRADGEVRRILAAYDVRDWQP